MQAFWKGGVIEKKGEKEKKYCNIKKDSEKKVT